MSGSETLKRNNCEKERVDIHIRNTKKGAIKEILTKSIGNIKSINNVQTKERNTIGFVTTVLMHLN